MEDSVHRLQNINLAIPDFFHPDFQLVVLHDAEVHEWVVGLNVIYVNLRAPIISKFVANPTDLGFHKKIFYPPFIFALEVVEAFHHGYNKR